MEVASAAAEEDFISLRGKEKGGGEGGAADVEGGEERVWVWWVWGDVV